jgi:rRNA-processing protein FCF1
MYETGIFTLEDLARYKIQYAPAGVIVDTNILLLFLVGNYSPEYIEECVLLHNSDKQYSKNDFELLKRIFFHFPKVVITPQIISEVSRHSFKIKKEIKDERFLAYLRSVIEFLKSAEERHQAADCLWGMPLEILGRFGFTDMTIFELARTTKMPILTDEIALYGYSYEQKVPVIKFEYIKSRHLQKYLG